ncbi:MAG: hypothetical protein E7Z85_00305 [Methanosphaera stadtmanae]|nr:hypothetical protein [Methanosphaera stadtmanae]
MSRKGKVHIIYCHPSKKSITYKIKEAYIKGLIEKRINYTITDLYELDFNTDISEEEYLRENNNMDYPLSEDIIQEQEKINDANILTFIFPLFWMDAPSKLVGYFSRVFTKGFKYDYDEGTNATMNIMDETNFLISAGSSYETLKDDGKVEALETIFVKDRMAGKTKRTNLYFFTETTFLKEKELNKLQNHIKKAKNIGKKTIF